MRLTHRRKEKMLLQGREIPCTLRPLAGGLRSDLFGHDGDDRLRAILPHDTAIAVGERVLVAGLPFICLKTRACVGHMEAEIRRCLK